MPWPSLDSSGVLRPIKLAYCTAGYAHVSLRRALEGGRKRVGCSESCRFCASELKDQQHGLGVEETPDYVPLDLKVDSGTLISLHP